MKLLFVRQGPPPFYSSTEEVILLFHLGTEADYPFDG